MKTKKEIADEYISCWQHTPAYKDAVTKTRSTIDAIKVAEQLFNINKLVETQLTTKKLNLYQRIVNRIWKLLFKRVYYIDWYNLPDKALRLIRLCTALLNRLKNGHYKP